MNRSGKCQVARAQVTSNGLLFETAQILNSKAGSQEKRFARCRFDSWFSARKFTARSFHYSGLVPGFLASEFAFGFGSEFLAFGIL
jgi:hypothetical protein